MRRLATLSLFALSFALAPLAWAADMQSADKPAMAASVPQDCQKMMDMHGKDGAGNGKAMGMDGKDMGCMNQPAAKAKAATKPKAKANAKKAEPEHDHETHTTK